MKVPARLAMRVRPWLLVLLLLLVYPVGACLPATWGWENGVVESAQLLLLLTAAGLSAIAAWRDRGHPLAHFGRGAAAVWLLLAGRETSWGGVFMPALSFDANTGPMFSSRVLWYRPVVTPLLLAVAAFVLWHWWRWRLPARLGAAVRAPGFPWLAIAVTLTAALAAVLFEAHLGTAGLPAGQHQVLEECAELVAYAGLLLAQVQVVDIWHRIDTRLGP